MQDTSPPVMSFQQTPDASSAQPTAQVAFSAQDAAAVSFQCVLQVCCLMQAGTGLSGAAAMLMSHAYVLPAGFANCFVDGSQAASRGSSGGGSSSKHMHGM